MLADLDLAGISVAIIGAGTIANRRLQSIGVLPARLVVVAPKVSYQFAGSLARIYEHSGGSVEDAFLISGLSSIESKKEGLSLQTEAGAILELRLRGYLAKDLEGISLAIAATDDPSVNDEVCALQGGKGLFASNATSGMNGNLRGVAVRRFANFQLGVGALRPAPAVSAWLCEQLAGAVTPVIDEFVGLCADAREEARADGRRVTDEGWGRVFGSPALGLVEIGQRDRAMDEIRQCLS